MTEIKRRKVGEKRLSRIFSPFRVLGNVSNDTPFAVGTLGSTFYIVTSVGRSFHIYDAANLHLLFVSHTQTPSRITCLAAHQHYVYVAYDSRVGVFKRGRLEAEIQATSPVAHMSVFGDYLVTASVEGIISVFKKPAGAKIASEPYTTIHHINSLLDGQVVGLMHPPTYLNKVAVATSRHVIIINVKTGLLLFRLPEMEGILAIEAAPVLDVVALGYSTGHVRLYNLKKGRVSGTDIVCAPADAQALVTSVSFRTDGLPHLVASLSNGDLFFYDLGRKARVHTAHNAHRAAHGGVARASFLNGQPIVVSCGGDNHLKEYVFDPALSSSNTSIVLPPRLLRARGGHLAPPVALEFAPTEDRAHYVFLASQDRTFWQFSLRKDAQAQELSQRPQKKNDGKRQAGPPASLRDRHPEIVAMAVSDARQGHWDGVVTAHKEEAWARTWDANSRRIGHHTLPTADGGLAKAVCVLQCGHFALVGSSLGAISVYNLQLGVARKRYMLHKKAVSGLAIDGMNRRMVSTGLDGVVGFYDFSQLQYLGKLQLEAPITSMVYHRLLDLVACALDDLSIVVVDAITQKIVRVLYGHTNRITALDFSPDGRWVVSCGIDSTLRTWDLPTGGCIDGIRLASVATAVRFLPAGDILATAHVAGNGIALWTNRAQFHPVLTRHVEETEFADSVLPNASGDGGASVLDGALDENHDEGIFGTHVLAPQLDEKLLTLSLGATTKYSTLLHLETIRRRNRPTEAPKKPTQAPFFLALSGSAVGDRASEAEGKVQGPKESTGAASKSRLREMRDDGHRFESEFTRLLREADYAAFLSHLVDALPAYIDLEVRLLALFPPLLEMAHLVKALAQGVRENTNYDLYQAVFSLFLKAHGDVVKGFPDEEELREALEEWADANNEGLRIDELTKYCSGVIGFLTTV